VRETRRTGWEEPADLQEPSEDLAAKTAHLKEKLVKLESAAADLNQHGRLEVEAALVVMLDTIAVLLRRESGCRPTYG
jgi:hypothetical protein